MKTLPIIPVWLLIILSVAIIGLLVYCLISKKYRKIDSFRRIGIIILVICILFRPVIRGGEGESQLSNFNLYFVVDLTNSMVAKDCDSGETRRFEKVREDIKTIARQFPGAQYTIITQDISTYIAMPLSTNLDTLYSYANAMTPKDEHYSLGTSISNLLNVTNEQLATYSKDHPERKNILFLFSDGEVTDTSSSSTVTTIKKYISSGYVFGYGTKNGAALESISASGKINDGIFIREPGGSSSSRHFSRIDEPTLKNIATALDINYNNRTFGSIPDNFGERLSKDEKLIGSETVESYIETYWVIALVLIGMILWDFYVVFNRLLLERREK